MQRQDPPRERRLHTIRTHRIGSNRSSDKYIHTIPVEDRHSDLALFIAHTGFAHVRNTRNRVDADFIPVFRSPADLRRHLDQMQTADGTCGLVVSSLDVAWRLVDQQSLLVGNELWYIMDEACFILYMHRGGLSVGTCRIISDPDAGDGGITTFRPELVSVSWDTFLQIQLKDNRTTKTSRHIFNALCIMTPTYNAHHGLTRHSVVNRLSKLRRIRDMEFSTGSSRV
jgi:hypothetical protein